MRSMSDSAWAGAPVAVETGAAEGQRKHGEGLDRSQGIVAGRSGCGPRTELRRVQTRTATALTVPWVVVNVRRTLAPHSSIRLKRLRSVYRQTG